MQNSISRSIFFLATLAFTTSLFAGHIGNRKVTQVRQWTTGYILVYVAPAIDNPASCATLTDRIVLDATGDQGLRNRQFSMLLTALTSGLYINPNCSNTCTEIWSDHQVTKCSDMSIKK